MGKRSPDRELEAPLSNDDIERMLDQAARNETLPHWQRTDPNSLVERKTLKHAGDPKIKDSDMNDLIAMFEAGKTNRQIADHYGYKCTATVGRMRAAWEDGDIAREFRARG